jgi:hypothetical protein
MAADLSELSSVASTLEQLARRIGSLGEQAHAGRQEDLSIELFAVERSLKSAERRLTRLVERRR